MTDTLKAPTQECRDLHCARANGHNVADPGCDWRWKFIGLDSDGWQLWRAVRSDELQ